jgi:chemotaxis protein methyltransferase CheR
MNADVDRFRHTITRWTGLTLDATPPGVLENLLAERVAASGGSSTAYLDRLAADRCRTELATLAPRLTVPETYFFRNSEQFRALVDVAVPALAPSRADRPLRLLSAGCATGEEAYTLAIVVREALPGRPVSVTGVDVNPTVLARARRARYPEWSMRATPAATRGRWFRPEGDGVVVDPEIRDLVRFVPGNLADDDPGWWTPGGYDVIFCRNVIMYHTREHIAAAVTRLVAALAPDGFLFLGHAETGYGRVAGLDLRHSHETFYFQRADPVESREPPPVVVTPNRPPVGGPSRRRARPAARAGGDAVARARDLLRQERFDDGLALIVGEPGPDAHLLRAVLLTDLGRLDEAETECRRLLDADGLHAGAHYLLAVTREGAGDQDSAGYHARTAAYLDPGFAMPRLRLGLLARSRGDTSVARRELAAALTLLAGETPDRLLLFGGGFTRTALADLCRTELRACGAAA